MKILINMKLGNSAVNAHIRPITQVERVDRIFIVRDNPGPNLPKVKYYCPTRFISRFAVLVAFYRFLALIYLSLFKKPDLIHSYLLFPHGTLAFIVAKITGRPISISLIAGPVELYAIGSPLGIKFTRPLPMVGKALLKILGNCDIVTTTGSFTMDFLIAHGVSRNHIHILHHSVSSQKYRAILVPKIYDVISIGRLVPIKHIEVLLRAISKVKRRYQHVKVGIVGDGPCGTELEKLSAELGINDNVDFLGFQNDVRYYYNSSKIFVLTSEREGFPLAFVEAMMCGVPSVVSNCGDILDIAKDGINSIVIDNYGDVNGYANAISCLLGDNEFYHTISQNAFETVSRLSVSRVTCEWGNILDHIMSNKAKS